MLITNVQIRDTKTGTRLEGVASITFDDMIVVHDIKIIASDEGYFLAMPSRRLPNGAFKDIAHPISKEARGSIERISIGGFRRMRELGETGLSMSLAPDCTAASMLEQRYEDFICEPKRPVIAGE